MNQNQIKERNTLNQDKENLNVIIYIINVQLNKSIDKAINFSSFPGQPE